VKESVSNVWRPNSDPAFFRRSGIGVEKSIGLYRQWSDTGSSVSRIDPDRSIAEKKGSCHADPACGRGICCFFLETNQKLIPRFGRDDIFEVFSSAC